MLYKAESSTHSTRASKRSIFLYNNAPGRNMTGEGIFTFPGKVMLERGGMLQSPQMAYRVWGRPKPDGSNIVWVCHALTGNADVTSWWPGLFGPGTLFDFKDYCVVCANVIGSCYGSTGPLSLDILTGQAYFSRFPEISIRDMVMMHRLLANHLGIHQIGILIGASLGGQQALEWAVQEPDRIARLVVIAANAAHSPWGVAFNESQRMAIEADSTWGEDSPLAGINGMRAARATALLSYRHYETYRLRQSSALAEQDGGRTAASYQRYQGEKLAGRFNAYSYYTLSKAMDTHDVGRGRGGIGRALSSVSADTLAISIDTDLLFPPLEQALIARSIAKAQYKVIHSDFGHDGFLTETEKLTDLLHNFINSSKRQIAQL